MPKKKSETTEGEGKVHAVKSGSSFDGDQLRGFLDRIKACQSDIDRINSEAKDDCQSYRDDIKEIRKEAQEAGFSKKELNALIRKERLELRLEHVTDSLTSDQKETFDQMLHALGDLKDTPLGAAAAARHEGAAAH